MCEYTHVDYVVKYSKTNGDLEIIKLESDQIDVLTGDKKGVTSPLVGRNTIGKGKL